MPNHFNKIVNQNYQGIYDNQLENTLANGRLYTSKIDQNQKELIDSIQEDLLKIYSEENKYIEFNSKTKHSGSSCTDKKIRVVINFNYE